MRPMAKGGSKWRSRSRTHDIHELMFNAKNPRHKLTPAQLEEMRKCFEDEGWKLLWIARFFKIDPRGVRFHAGTNGWVRRAKITKYMPAGVAKIYSERKKQHYLEKAKGTYEFIQMSAQFRKTSDCEHRRWVKRCSVCSEIIGSDATDHKH